VFTQLPQLLDRIKRLEQQVEELSGGESTENTTGDEAR
jgi:hypothetical protein